HVSRAQFGEFARARAADKKQQTRALPLSFIDGERGSRALSAGRNCHNELARLRHGNQFRSVQTKEDYAGRELRSIEHANVTNRWPGKHRFFILASIRTYSR